MLITPDQGKSAHHIAHREGDTVEAFNQ